MHAHFQYRLTRDEYVIGLGALMGQLARQDTNRIARLFEQLAMILVILAVVAITFPQAFIGLLVAILLLAILQELLRPRWVRSATGQSYDPAVADHDIEITDGAIVSRSSLRERRWSWGAVRRIHDLKQAVVLEVVGWDMIVLPNQLWANGDARRAFLNDIRALATDALPAEPTRRPITIDAHDLLTVGAFGAAIDTLFLIVVAFPAHRGPGPAISDAAFVGTFAAIVLLGLVLAYGVYRVAKIGLARLHAAIPQAASLLAYLLIWALPIYMLGDYFGWL